MVGEVGVRPPCGARGGQRRFFHLVRACGREPDVPAASRLLTVGQRTRPFVHPILLLQAVPNLHPPPPQFNKPAKAKKAQIMTTSGQTVPIYQYNIKAGSAVVHTVKQVGPWCWQCCSRNGVQSCDWWRRARSPAACPAAWHMH